MNYDPIKFLDVKEDAAHRRRAREHAAWLIKTDREMREALGVKPAPIIPWTRQYGPWRYGYGYAWSIK